MTTGHEPNLLYLGTAEHRRLQDYITSLEGPLSWTTHTPSGVIEFGGMVVMPVAVPSCLQCGLELHS